MKKVGIITLNGYKNYGNRLQNYALQTIIENFGYNVETILYFEEPPKESLRYKIMRNLKNLKDIRKKFNNKFNTRIKKLRNFRILVFKDFTKKYIKETNYH